MAIPSKYIDGGDMGLYGEIRDIEILDDGTVVVKKIDIHSVSPVEENQVLVDPLTNKEVEIKTIGGAEILTLEEIVKLTEGVTDAPPKPTTETDRPKPPQKQGDSPGFCCPEKFNPPPRFS